MNLSKQTLLGTGVLLGGSILLYATIHQVNNTNQAAQANNAVASVAQAPTDTNATSTPLTADIQTEKNILAQKQKEREARVEQQELAAQQYLTEQQKIEAEALARSRAENQLYVSGRTANSTAIPVTRPEVKPIPVTDDVATLTEEDNAAATVTTRVQDAPVQAIQPKPKSNPQPAVKATAKPEVKPQPKPIKVETKPETKVEKAEVKPTARPSRYQVQRGEGLISLSRRYDVPVDALAQANGLSTNAALHVGQTLNIPSASEVTRLKQEAAQRERERQQEIARKQQEAAQKEQQRQQEIARKKQEAAQKAQQKQDYQAAQQKLKQARQTVKETDAKGSFGVQVALAADQAKAQEIARKLQAAGYKVKTSQTTRGVRVVVGPETGKVAALALKDKVNSDPRLDTNNAWVLFW